MQANNARIIEMVIADMQNILAARDEYGGLYVWDIREAMQLK